MINSVFIPRSLFRMIATLFACCTLTFGLANEYNIIPYPQQLTPQSGAFVFNKNTVVLYSKGASEIQKLAQQFSTQMEVVSGLKLTVKEQNTLDTTNAVILELNNSQGQNPEAYSLNVCTKTIHIKASAANGIFYGLQSMYQLLPAEIYGKKKVAIKKWSVPAVKIVDVPRFGYRGLHLDVCRHFFSVEFIKKYIDAMAIHKLNTFHWHLTDDQGWRIEIKKYPLLTQVGSNRDKTLIGYYFENLPQQYDEKAYGGYYTQLEAREVVAYAKARFITVIPEIEMPGHAMAAIAAYPFLSCTRSHLKVAERWGIFKDVYCPRDSTFDFLENVLTEIMDIFPSTYIHIGGDECPKDRWKACPDCQALIRTQNLKDENGLQSYFVHRIEQFLNAHGRQIIGWDEILDGGLATNATVMSWQGIAGGIAAAKAGNDVIMTPGTHCYFDKYQSNPETEPMTIGGYLPLKKVYFYEPVPTELNPEQAKHVLGAQANVWTEYMPTSERVEYMAFPRVSALSEVLWSDTLNRNWNRFRTNMPKELERYTALGIHPSNAYFDVTNQTTTTTENELLVTLESDYPNAEIHYTVDGNTPTKSNKLYTVPFELAQSAIVKAVSLVKDKVVSNQFSRSFLVSKATGLSYKQNPVNTWYKGDNVYSLTDGLLGNTKTYGQWVAVGGSKDGEFIIDLLKTQSITCFSVGLLSAPAFSGMYPAEIKFYTSLDGIDYHQVASQIIKPRTFGAWKIYRPELIFAATDARFVKLVLISAGNCPNVDGIIGNSSMFLDEIGVW